MRFYSSAKSASHMKLRFTIRDLLWLTLMVALCAAWWIDRRHLVASHDKYKQNLQNLTGSFYLNNLIGNPAEATGEGWGDEQVERAYQEHLKEEERERSQPMFGGGAK